MTQRGRDVAFEHVGSQVSDFSAAHRFDKVFLMPVAAVTGELFEPFVVVVVCPAAASAASRVLTGPAPGRGHNLPMRGWAEVH
jgi:hypothetical protein